MQWKIWACGMSTVGLWQFNYPKLIIEYSDASAFGRHQPNKSIDHPAEKYWPSIGRALTQKTIFTVLWHTTFLTWNGLWSAWGLGPVHNQMWLCEWLLVLQSRASQLTDVSQQEADIAYLAEISHQIFPESNLCASSLYWLEWSTLSNLNVNNLCFPDMWRVFKIEGFFL